MSCAICGSALLRDFYRKNDRLMTICAHCRHVSWHDMPTDDQITKYYSDEYTASHNQFEQQKIVRDYFVSHVQELLRLSGKKASDLTVVDVGCSYPVFCECAKDAGCSALGIDWSIEAQEYGRSVGVPVLTPPEFLENIEPRSVDVLRYSHSLEHMVDPLGALGTHVAKLKQGGLVYVTQPNFPVFKAEACDVELKDSVWPAHLHFFNPISLTTMLDRCKITTTTLFSVSDEVDAEVQYRKIIDLVYAARRLEAFAPLGDPGRGPLNNFPHYTGMNVGAYGVLRE